MLAALFAALSAVIPAWNIGAQAVKVSSVLSPDGPLRRHPAQLVVTVESNAALSGASLVVVAPEGLLITPDGNGRAARVGKGSVTTIPLDAFTGSSTQSMRIEASGSALQRASYRLPIAVYAAAVAGQPRTALAQGLVTIGVSPEISVADFMWLGVLGIAVGYALRLLLKILAGITPPPLVEAETKRLDADGSARRKAIVGFIREHYYTTDFVVTLMIGVIALIALIKEAHVPDAGASWNGALITGVSLGLLTNSELVTRIRA